LKKPIIERFPKPAAVVFISPLRGFIFVDIFIVITISSLRDYMGDSAVSTLPALCGKLAAQRTTAAFLGGYALIAFNIFSTDSFSIFVKANHGSASLTTGFFPKSLSDAPI
jgi:hypothetical protein